MNGILIPIIIGIIFFQVLSSLGTEEYNEEGVIIGDVLEKAKSDSVALQGISYDSPCEIYNSTNYYLPIAVTTYEEAKAIREMISSAGDMNFSYFQIMNILFLNEDIYVQNYIFS